MPKELKQALYALEGITSPLTLSEAKEVDEACAILRDAIVEREKAEAWMKRWRENQEIQKKIVAENKLKETFMSASYTYKDFIFAVAYGIALGLLIAAFI